MTDRNGPPDRPYDVVFVPLGAADFGGAERSLLEIAARLVAMKASVLVVAEGALRDTPFVKAAESLGVPIHWVDWAPGASLSTNLMTAARLFRKLRASVVHFNISWREGMWTIPLIARLVCGARLVGTMRAIPNPPDTIARGRHFFGLIPGLQLWRLPDLFSGRIWARALHATVSVNRESFPKRLRAEYGFDGSRVHVIYNGVEAPSPDPFREGKRATRTKWGFTDDDFVVGFVGRLAPEKGLHELVTAVSSLPDTVKCVIVGSGPEESALRDQIRRTNAARRIVVAGFAAEPRLAMAACDVVAVPSTVQEAFGRTVVEALSVEVPVIASRIGGMAEIFADGIQGWYVRPGQSDDLCATIANALEHRDALRAMGRRGRQLVLERYEIGRVISEYISLYETLLRDSGHAGRFLSTADGDTPMAAPGKKQRGPG